MPVTPTSCSASFTSSSLKGLMIASIFFMASRSHVELPRARSPAPWPSSIGNGAHDRPAHATKWRKLRSLDNLSVNREVQPFAFHLAVDTQPDRQIHELEQDQCSNRVVHGDDRDGIELRDHLMRIAVEQAILTSAFYPGYGQHAGQEGAQCTAHTMHAENIETVDKARRRSDRDQAGDRARDNAEHARLTLDEPLGEHPGKSGSRGGDLGHCH